MAVSNGDVGFNSGTCLLVNQCSNGKAVETVSERLPQLDVVSAGGLARTGLDEHDMTCLRLHSS